MTLRDSVAGAVLPALPIHLIEELNHRVINEYTEAIFSLSTAASRSTSSQAREVLRLAMNRLLARADAHRALMPPTAAGTVNLGDYLAGLCTSLLKASLEENGVEVLLVTDEIWIDGELCWRIGLILAELIRNAARPGLAGRSGAIAVQIVTSAGQLHCVVGANGAASESPTPGRGQRLIQSIAAEIGASVSWQFTPRGSVARLAIPADT